MSFPFQIYWMVGLSALAVTAVSLPLWRRVCVRIGLVDDPGHRKIHDTPIPLAGGLAVLTGLVVPLIAGALALALAPSGWLGSNTADLLSYGLGRRTIPLLAMLAGGLGMVALGVLDDRHELRPAAKFSGQFLIAALVAAAGVRITLFVENPIFSYAVTILWILTVTNACNFMDNMNGLCAGLGFIAAWGFAWVAAVQGQYLVAATEFLFCGALLGFLPFNFPRARVFLGDAGSHLIGYLLAVMAILPHFYTPKGASMLAVLKPLLILAVILGDLVWVVALRTRIGQPFWIGDTNHLSHRLVRRGLSRTSAVLVIWLLAAVAAGLAFI